MTELETIKHARRHIQDDPGLAVYMVRDLEATKTAEMTDICWEISRQGFSTTDEAVWILDKVEATARALAEASGDGQEAGDGN